MAAVLPNGNDDCLNLYTRTIRDIWKVERQYYSGKDPADRIADISDAVMWAILDVGTHRHTGRWSFGEDKNYNLAKAKKWVRLRANDYQKRVRLAPAPESVAFDADLHDVEEPEPDASISVEELVSLLPFIKELEAHQAKTEADEAHRRMVDLNKFRPIAPTGRPPKPYEELSERGKRNRRRNGARSIEAVTMHRLTDEVFRDLIGAMEGMDS